MCHPTGRTVRYFLGGLAPGRVVCHPTGWCVIQIWRCLAPDRVVPPCRVACKIFSEPAGCMAPCQFTLEIFSETTGWVTGWRPPCRVGDRVRYSVLRKLLRTRSGGSPPDRVRLLYVWHYSILFYFLELV